VKQNTHQQVYALMPPIVHCMLVELEGKTRCMEMELAWTMKARIYAWAGQFFTSLC